MVFNFYFSGQQYFWKLRDSFQLWSGLNLHFGVSWQRWWPLFIFGSSVPLPPIFEPVRYLCYSQMCLFSKFFLLLWRRVRILCVPTFQCVPWLLLKSSMSVNHKSFLAARCTRLTVIEMTSPSLRTWAVSQIVWCLLLASTKKVYDYRLLRQWHRTRCQYEYCLPFFCCLKY